MGFVIPGDGAILNFGYIGVPRTSAHPNLATLFVNMVLSEEGQKIVYEYEGTDHHALPGTRWATQLAELKARGVDLLRADARFVADNPDQAKLKDELVRIIRERPSS